MLYNRAMSIAEAIHTLRMNRDFMSQVVAWERLPARSAELAPWPDLDPRLCDTLQRQGIDNLYTHQSAAVAAALRGDNVVVATATASGKSLCYTLPVLQRLLDKPKARALYLFPTKALAQDQFAATQALIHDGGLPLEVGVYDGDTARHLRTAVRKNSHIVISNPDMLHAGMLPYHPQWRDLFGRIEYVVIDEIHTYRGVFGSHVANVLRRLQRICAFHGSRPQFICCSATIANPLEHAERLVERPFTLIDERQNGAPHGEKQFILYNPPIFDQELGLRQSALITAMEAGTHFLKHDVQTVLFARTRQSVELLLTYLRDQLDYANLNPDSVTGYRGGYLPNERRAIEAGLRDGSLQGVVATNALELGVDIGQLDAAVLTGYPGSIASVWQQAGRAGRRVEQSAVMMIAGNSPLDQYICRHPRYLFGRTPEHALINPDNLRIMVSHIQCAAFEMPFDEGEPWGDFGPVDALLDALRESGVLHQTRGRSHWIGECTPSSTFSLRTSSTDTVVIQAIDGDAGTATVIGEVDLDSAPLMVYEGAIYSHRAETYLVDELDWDGRIAYVRPREVDYYTRATVSSDVREMEAVASAEADDVLRAHGEVLVVSKATGYRKIKRYSHETLGYGNIDLPELTLDTTGYWLVFGDKLTEQLYDLGVLFRPNQYGPNWQTQRRQALNRDSHRCRTCGAAAKDGRTLHVHHIRPIRDYGYIPGANDAYLQANQLDNLITLCPSCHRQAEASVQARSALGGLAYVLRNLAPLFLMCDPTDLQVVAESRSPLTDAPTIVVYEQIAAGVGLSERLFELHHEVLAAALELVSDCDCSGGCPACVGPPGEIGPDTKAVTKRLLRILCGGK
ncbi:MAG: DEAD/DEAH box helicase [Anaerolineae bacterium]|nr:DEAD/DEAH box helicase [Anaerolineae bacterium]